MFEIVPINVGHDHTLPPILSAYAWETSMSDHEIHAVIRQAIAAWEHGNAEQFAALFTEHGEFVVPGDRWVGRDAIRQVTADFSAEHTVAIDVHQIIIQDQRAAVEWSWHETNRSTGKSSQAEDVIMVDFVAGKVQRWREYIDTQSVPR